MAYVDAQGLFSDAQTITSSAASTNTIDLGAVRDIGTGEDLYVMVTVDTTMDDTGDNSSLTVALQGDSSTSFTPDGTQDLFTIPALSAAGTKFFAKLDPNSAPLQYRYIRLNYTPNNGDLSAGAFTAALVEGIEQLKYYASGYTVS